MKSFSSLVVITLLVYSCAPKEQKQEVAQTGVEAVAASPLLPQLTDQQKADGWMLLFDGKSTQGWQIFKSRKNNTWEAVNGILHAKALKEGVNGDGDERSDIMTTDVYDNFELTFDWKISAEGNSGVMFRVTEEFEQPYYSGPEYQIVDDKGFPGKLKDVQHTGADYDMHAATNPNINPVGEWNTAKILANGNHVEHWLNGSKVLEYEISSTDWNERKGNSKWKEWKGYGIARKGHIAFQDHGSEVWFRNIMIKKI